jgi:c-di-GMP-binding flagellar brake protein YcgR
MDLLNFKIGSPLRLEIFDANGVMINKNFASQFEEAVGADEAFIAVPIVEGVFYAVRAGWHIMVYSQEGNTFYRFRARIAERLTQEGRPVLRISRLGEIDVAQRRNFYRFKCDMRFKYRIITNFKDDSNKPFSEGRTTDISGSGLGFTSRERIDMESLIEFVIKLEGKALYLIGSIKRCAKIMAGDTERVVYNVGVLFSEIEEWQREQIVKYIFNEERRQLKLPDGRSV